MARAADMGGQAKRFWTGLTPARRMSLVVALIVIAGGVVALSMLSGRIDYAPVFTNLSPEDAGLIAQKLKELKVPFQVDGRALLVPRERAAQLRLELAAEGMPRGGGIGFELFDKRTLGQSEFTQKLNYRRALMGELSRTISTLQGVERARVHLALPERSLFADRQQAPSAAVVLKLRPGHLLSGGQVQGMVHLVASAVEGLKAEAVTIVDEEGRMLWRPRHGPPDAVSPEAHIDEERALEHRAAEMLERVVGVGHAVVRVSADLDMERNETTVEDYDPEVHVLRSEQQTREMLGGARATTVTGGIPGTTANVPGATTPPAPASTTTASPASRESAVRNYEIKRTLRRTVNTGGRVRKLSVAVLVDGRYEEKNGQKVFSPRDPAEIAKLEELVKGAVGFQRERGDQVTVKSIPFDPTVTPGGVEAVVAAAVTEAMWPVYAKWGAVGLIVLLSFFFVIRPVLRAVLSAKAPSGADPGGEAASAPAPVPSAAVAAPAPVGRAALRPGGGEVIEIPATPREEALQIVRSDPKRAAQVLRRWIQEKAT
jgi:flagellar M-ring protein FliF